MTELHEIRVSLSPNQKKNLSNAFHKKEIIVLRLTKDSLSGNDTLYVPSTENWNVSTTSIYRHMGTSSKRWR